MQRNRCCQERAPCFPVAIAVSIGTMSTLIDNSLFRSAVIALAYFHTAEQRQLGAVFPGWNLSLFWPPSGIALAAVFLFRFSAAPGIFLGAFASNLMQMPSASDPAMLLTCVGI